MGAFRFLLLYALKTFHLLLRSPRLLCLMQKCKIRTGPSVPPFLLFPHIRPAGSCAQGPLRNFEIQRFVLNWNLPRRLIMWAEGSWPTWCCGSLKANPHSPPTGSTEVCELHHKCLKVLGWTFEKTDTVLREMAFVASCNQDATCPVTAPHRYFNNHKGINPKHENYLPSLISLWWISLEIIEIH